MTEEMELWFRDPVECVQELISNPLFCEKMVYGPEQLYKDEEMKEEVWNVMNTGEWWWKMQVSCRTFPPASKFSKQNTYCKAELPIGATIAPIILSSDKTRLSQFRGDKSAWPVYLTIRNINKATRRQGSSHAIILLGYLPVPKLDCCTEKTRKLMRYTIFHRCMKQITHSLIAAGTKGCKMACADGHARNVFPILAAYVADYPEQCLVACCMENRCPICQVAPDARGTHQPAVDRIEKETLSLIDTPGISSATLKASGVRPVPSPFWRDLPHTSIFQSFTPDLLHQLHKGVFKDHLIKWCTTLVGEDELDDRLRSIPTHPNLRHFSNGISAISQWTGREHKEMQKVVVSLLSGAVEDRVIHAVMSIVDFIYLASLHSHTTSTLRALENALDEFHWLKDIFIELEARFPGHFNIPKIHLMDHYARLIRLYGSADGYNTESPERLHIDYAKEAYRASNRRDYTIQMVKWLRRQEAIERFTTYLL